MFTQHPFIFQLFLSDNYFVGRWGQSAQLIKIKFPNLHCRQLYTWAEISMCRSSGQGAMAKCLEAGKKKYLKEGEDRFSGYCISILGAVCSFSFVHPQTQAWWQVLQQSLAFDHKGNTERNSKDLRDLISLSPCTLPPFLQTFCFMKLK